MHRLSTMIQNKYCVFQSNSERNKFLYKIWQLATKFMPSKLKYYQKKHFEFDLYQYYIAFYIGI